MSSLLSRQAECLFWMARQIERANNLARILDVNETFSRNSQGVQNWEALLRLYADEERFYKNHSTPSPESIIHFYISDLSNPGSVIANLRAARENSRTLRPLISTEMWLQLNVFYSQMRDLTPRDLAEEKLSSLCSFIKQSCQTQSGVVAETLYRDEAWNFYQLGTNIERADQTTRLLDVKYEVLLPTPLDVGSALDVAQWNALLRSAAGFQAYRRIHHRGMTAASVAGFLLLNDHFPRSVIACVREAADTLNSLRREYKLEAGAAVARRLEDFYQGLLVDEIEAIINRGLHEALDKVQQELIGITDDLGRAFFGHELEPVPEPASMSQSQS